MWYIIWRILNSTHFKVLFKCFQAIFIELQREQFFNVALLFYKKMAVLALFKTNHTGPSSTGSLGLHWISADTWSPLSSWDEKWDINKCNLFPQITLMKMHNWLIWTSGVWFLKIIHCWIIIAVDNDQTVLADNKFKRIAWCI